MGKVPKRFKQTTNSDHDDPIAANLLNRDFAAAAPNQRWVGETTEFVIGESGKLDLAAILDLYSRFVVGWAVSAVNDRRLTLKALEMAIRRRCPEPGLLHSVLTPRLGDGPLPDHHLGPGLLRVVKNRCESR